MITTNTTLDRNLLNCPHDGIVIGADNITLRLAGHTVDGVRASGSAGVRVGVHRGVTVTGPGSVTEFAAGIVVGGFGGPPPMLADRVTGLTVSRNRTGILVGTGTSSRVDTNTVVSNLQNGIELSLGANSNSVQNNTVSFNGASGIGVSGGFFPARGNVVATNRVTSNRSYGILAFGENTFVFQNTALFNTSDGINVAGSGSVVRSDRASANGGHGIVAGSGVTDGGGNSGFFNRQPPQCVNVFCPLLRFII